MTSLQKIFESCMLQYGIFPNLDETYCYTPKRTQLRSKYIGSVYSLSHINEIIECISEEGSANITYGIESKDYKIKITNILISLFIHYGFDPLIDNNENISIVITEKDIYNEDDEDYVYDEDEEDEDKDNSYDSYSEYDYDNDEYEDNYKNKKYEEEKGEKDNEDEIGEKKEEKK